MNWLMYIGGGFLWCVLWSFIASNNEANPYCVFVASILSWVWICWRFIK